MPGGIYKRGRKEGEGGEEGCRLEKEKETGDGGWRAGKEDAVENMRTSIWSGRPGMVDSQSWLPCRCFLPLHT